MIINILKMIGLEKKDCSGGVSPFLYALTVIFMLFLICGFNKASFAEQPPKDSLSSAAISNIEIVDNAVRIKVQGPIKYTIYKSADPFTVTVEIEGASIGRFTEKIVSTMPGITEIVPVQLSTPTFAARLNILLQSPAEIKSEVKDDTLILNLEKAAVETQRAAPKAEAVPASKDGSAREITDIFFDRDKGMVELVIKADGKLAEPAVYQLDGTVMLDIPSVSLKASLPAKLPKPVRDIKVKTDKDRLKFVITTESQVATEIYILDDEIVVDFLSNEVKGKKQVDAKGAPIQDKVVNGTKVISLDFQDADIVPILRLLGDVGGYNIVVHPDVKGKITMKLMNVPWNQALDIVLKTFNLEKVIEGNIIRIATVKAFQEEKKSVAENKELFGKAEDISTRVFTINYANVERVRDSIEKGKILSPRGTISVDARTRALIVKDIPASIDEVQRLLSAIDKPTQQVLIEARIIEMNSNFARSLGVDWGLFARTRVGPPGSQGRAVGSSGGDNIPGGGVNVINPSDGSIIRTINTPPVISLPAATSTIVSPTSAITFGFLNRAETLGLDLRISAIEDTGNAKIISSPKILTIDNQEAIIKQGQRIPVTTLQSGTGGGAATFSTTYIDALLKLVVTPQISPDGAILLKLEIDKDQPNLSIRDTLGNPAIDTKQALTQVVLKDGETIVIGGIFTNTETNDANAVPGLGKIPLLGWLFRKDTVEKASTELLIFITPRIAQ